MDAAIIIIGNELLAGFTLDSNSTWLGRKLIDLGVEVVLKMTVGDSKADILEAIEVASRKADIVFSTGGLGPTHDDVTKEAFCEFMGANLQFDQQYYALLEKAFHRRGMKMSKSNREQALVPDKGEVIPNPHGSALGIKFVEDGRRYYVLPGVPGEMKSMIEKTILPELKEIAPGDLTVTTIRTTGIVESMLFDSLSDLVEESDVKVAFIPGFMGVDLRLTSRDAAALLELSSAIFERVGNYVYAEDWETLEETVGNLLRESELTLAVAESCTGGLLGHRITEISGSSDYFLGGIVGYSNEAKMSLLGVGQKTLETSGAVSEQTATEMAQGVRQEFRSDIGLSITGIAGPTGGSTDKPVGLTYIGLDLQGTVEVKSFIFSKDRRFNKELAAQAALNLVRLAIQ